ncbi:DUF4258 domain-containing protein [Aerophototrophica crusticola]|uniref:DUF4258 domain-containing protein n=1 Tax=Aerophototrophica crusticola TaxID=1709002 RepID=A0A858R652_9PROT|nr:DUF4258 domain-containing protein [Rhodospirillaceae bacterium B3]
MGPLAFSAHAMVAMEERRIERPWVERVVEAPAWTEPDASDPTLRLMFGPVPERDGRILRVVYSPGAHRVVTVFLDRTRRHGPRGTMP